ncbi:MAG: acyl-CoA carboxylase subunit beta, partial [Bacteroidetes bacterium]
MSQKELAANQNEDELKLMLSRMQHKLEKIYQGGGQAKIAKLHKQGKMTARERIDYLIDDHSTFLEIGAFAGEGMYEAYGGCPAGGVVTGIGYVSGRQCMIIANDATVKAGAWFPITGKKNLRAQEIAMEN